MARWSGRLKLLADLLIGVAAAAMCILCSYRSALSLHDLYYAQIVALLPQRQHGAFHAPGVLFLGNGISFGGCGGECQYEEIVFEFSAADIVQYRELFLKLPSWAAKNAITSILHRPVCKAQQATTGSSIARRSADDNPCSSEGRTLSTNRCMCLASFPQFAQVTDAPSFRSVMSLEMIEDRCGSYEAYYAFEDIVDYYAAHAPEAIFEFAPESCRDLTISGEQDVLKELSLSVVASSDPLNSSSVASLAVDTSSGSCFVSVDNSTQDFVEVNFTMSHVHSIMLHSRLQIGNVDNIVDFRTNMPLVNHYYKETIVDGNDAKCYSGGGGMTELRWFEVEFPYMRALKEVKLKAWGGSLVCHAENVEVHVCNSSLECERCGITPASVAPGSFITIPCSGLSGSMVRLEKSADLCKQLGVCEMYFTDMHVSATSLIRPTLSVSVCYGDECEPCETDRLPPETGFSTVRCAAPIFGDSVMVETASVTPFKTQICDLRVLALEAFCDESPWPGVLEHCGECRALVGQFQQYQTCTSYCSNQGRECSGAFVSDSFDCTVSDTKSCHDVMPSVAMCECSILKQDNEIEPSLRVITAVTATPSGDDWKLATVGSFHRRMATAMLVPSVDEEDPVTYATFVMADVSSITHVSFLASQSNSLTLVNMQIHVSDPGVLNLCGIVPQMMAPTDGWITVTCDAPLEGRTVSIFHNQSFGFSQIHIFGTDLPDLQYVPENNCGFAIEVPLLNAAMENIDHTITGTSSGALDNNAGSSWTSISHSYPSVLVVEISTATVSFVKLLIPSTVTDPSGMLMTSVHVCGQPALPSKCSVCGYVSEVTPGGWVEVACLESFSATQVRIIQPAGETLEISGIKVFACPTENMAADTCSCLKCVNQFCASEYSVCSCSDTQSVECLQYLSCIDSLPPATLQSCCSTDAILQLNSSTDGRVCEAIELTNEYRDLINAPPDFDETVTEQYCEAILDIVDSIPSQELTPFVLILISGPTRWGALDGISAEIKLRNNESGIWGLTTPSFEEMRERFSLDDKYGRYELLVDLIDGYSWNFASASLDQVVQLTKTIVREEGQPETARMQNEYSFKIASSIERVKSEISWKSDRFFVASTRGAFEIFSALQMVCALLLMIDRAYNTFLRVYGALRASAGQKAVGAPGKTGPSHAHGPVQSSSAINRLSPHSSAEISETMHRPERSVVAPKPFRPNIQTTLAERRQRMQQQAQQRIQLLELD